jgi:hypothetical protein
MSKYLQACNEAESLKTDKDEALKEKENEINQVKSQLDGMKKLHDALSPDMRRIVMAKSDIVKKFKDMAIPHVPPLMPCQKEWKLLMETMECTNPSLYGRIVFSEKLSQQEIHACLLTMLHFSPGELAVLLGTSKQRVSNIKAFANFKLFGNKDAKKLLENLNNIQNADC